MEPRDGTVPEVLLRSVGLKFLAVWLLFCIYTVNLLVMVWSYTRGTRYQTLPLDAVCFKMNDWLTPEE